MSKEKAIALIRARQAGVLRTMDEADVKEWHKRCGDFRDAVGDAQLTGGAFVVGETHDQEGFIPLVCVRGDVTTLAAAVRGVMFAWMAQGKAQGTPVTRERVAEIAAQAIEQWEAMP